MPEPRPLLPATVLVVDDEPALRHLAQRVLADAGYHAVEATDGVDALATMNTLRVDLVLADVSMPGMGGIELVRELRARWPGQRVVLMSARPVAACARLDGADDQPLFLPKPFTRGALLAAVEEAVRRAPLSADPRRGSWRGPFGSRSAEERRPPDT